MKILSKKEYNRLKNLSNLNLQDKDEEYFPIILANKDLELKLQDTRDMLVDLQNAISNSISKNAIKKKVSKIIDFIERGKI